MTDARTPEDLRAEAAASIDVALDAVARAVSAVASAPGADRFVRAGQICRVGDALRKARVHTAAEAVQRSEGWEGLEDEWPLEGREARELRGEANGGVNWLPGVGGPHYGAGARLLAPPNLHLDDPHALTREILGMVRPALDLITGHQAAKRSADRISELASVRQALATDPDPGLRVYLEELEKQLTKEILADAPPLAPPEGSVELPPAETERDHEGGESNERRTEGARAVSLVRADVPRGPAPGGDERGRDEADGVRSPGERGSRAPDPFDSRPEEALG
jgi:hypothetical protein